MSAPTPAPEPLPPLSFDAGDFSAGKRSTDDIIILSNGLSARPIARAGSYVELANGKTPWNSWITCEEVSGGRVIQTDPYGRKPPAETKMGTLGYYESFAFDDGTDTPMFYVARDKSDGVITRFTPDEEGMKCYLKKKDYERWCTLESGSIDYLYLGDGDNAEWATDYGRAQGNAENLYPHSEGIDVLDGVLYSTSKEKKLLAIVNLRTLKYSISSTKSGAFDAQPDQIERVLGSNAEMLFLCEDGGKDAGLHGRDKSGQYFTILYADSDKIKENGLDTEETTGLGLRPDFMHLCVLPAYRDNL